MAGSPRKRERKQRTEQVVQDVHSIDVICAHVSAGGTLAEWCRQKDIPYTDIVAWMNADEARRKRYIESIELRRTHQEDEVITALREMINTDIADAFDERGALKPLQDMPVALRRMIASIEVEELFAGKGDQREMVGYTKKVKLWPKDKAVELMARHRKMLTDKVDVGVRTTLADLLSDP